MFQNTQQIFLTSVKVVLAAILKDWLEFALILLKKNVVDDYKVEKQIVEV